MAEWSDNCLPVHPHKLPGQGESISLYGRVERQLSWLDCPPPTQAKRGRFPGGGGVAPSRGAMRLVPVLSRVSRFPRPCIPAIHHTHLTSPSSTLKNSMLLSWRLRGLCKESSLPARRHDQIDNGRHSVVLDIGVAMLQSILIPCWAGGGGLGVLLTAVWHFTSPTHTPREWTSATWCLTHANYRFLSAEVVRKFHLGMSTLGIPLLDVTTQPPWPRGEKEIAMSSLHNLPRHTMHCSLSRGVFVEQCRENGRRGSSAINFIGIGPSSQYRDDSLKVGKQGRGIKGSGRRGCRVHRGR
ncbi:hypothetical protein PR048_016640 [Dryococelus australis]|uniref:Uncharacterized protein n=1 Tax=Dryococelus australis TaxID=614101 RepID=A0ABQ9H774_9NEOP|nr:hypothetical protein PR048_016640 [Dryococelus australis]